MVVVKKRKIMTEIVATTSLPVDRLTATDCNAAARANTSGAWKYVKPYVIEPSDQLLLNKLFDPSTPSMRT